MRTGKITVNGKNYLLCFSAKVILSCSDRYGNVDGIWKKLSSDSEAEVLKETFWLLSEMMDAGAAYAKLTGVNNPKPLTEEELLVLVDLSDLANLKAKIFETVSNGNERTVETETDVADAKNVDTTQQN